MTQILEVYSKLSTKKKKKVIKKIFPGEDFMELREDGEDKISTVG
jgi:hypothetical protein